MQPLTHIGPYKLGQAIRDYPAARKLSWWSNLLWGHKTAGETLYRCPGSVRFLNGDWHIILGVFQDHICKISARHISRSQAPMTAMLLECTEYCRRQFGIPSAEPTAATWQTPFGKASVEVMTATTGGGRGVYRITFEMAATLRAGNAPLHVQN